MTGAGYRDTPLRADELNSNFIGAPFTHETPDGTEIVGKIGRIVTPSGARTVEIWVQGAVSAVDATGVIHAAPDAVFYIGRRAATWEHWRSDE